MSLLSVSSIPVIYMIRPTWVFAQDRFALTPELQQYVAGNSQRVAKLICQKADFEVQKGNAA